MAKHDIEEIQIIFDQRTHSASITLGELTAQIPFPIYSLREANIMGREFARNLGWPNRPGQGDKR